MNTDTFSGFHPIVNMLYFVAVIGFSMFLMHPINLAISLFCAFIYATYLGGRRFLRLGLLFMLPMLLLTAVLNPLFNHQGATILMYLPNGNPLTLESALFGVAASVMLITVIAWFSCFNAVVSSDKLVYLIGRKFPVLSLILSMSLRFVPRFISQIKIVMNAQKCIGLNADDKNIFHKVQFGIKIVSIVVTWALENAIETGDSMKSRGYGLPNRTSFSIFIFSKRDVVALVYILVCTTAIILGVVMGVYRFRYFPTIMHIEGGFAGFWTVFLFVVYLFLCAFPLIINIKEDLFWKCLESKI